ncbi:MAG: hypothetical protein KKA64_02530 [Nanoarchaeota archaeon]|nr:hypothetical protein [Nanoarchaeota archaeon]
MKISKEKKDRISEQILALLYSKSPQAIFTSHIAREIARDEEFTKKILITLKDKNLIKEIKKSPKGKTYSKRSRWVMGELVYDAYKNHQ